MMKIRRNKVGRPVRGRPRGMTAKGFYRAWNSLAQGQQFMAQELKDLQRLREQVPVMEESITLMSRKVQMDEEQHRLQAHTIAQLERRLKELGIERAQFVQATVEKLRSEQEQKALANPQLKAMVEEENAKNQGARRQLESHGNRDNGSGGGADDGGVAGNAGDSDRRAEYKATKQGKARGRTPGG